MNYNETMQTFFSSWFVIGSNRSLSIPNLHEGYWVRNRLRRVCENAHLANSLDRRPSHLIRPAANFVLSCCKLRLPYLYTERMSIPNGSPSTKASTGALNKVSTEMRIRLSWKATLPERKGITESLHQVASSNIWVTFAL